LISHAANGRSDR
jgi:hypothetical protein